MIVRPARPGDEDAVAQIRVASWRATYRGVVPDSYLDAMSAEENAPQWAPAARGEQPGVRLLICEDESRVVGFAAFGAARAPQFGYGGELYAIYFLPDAIGKGFGNALAKKAMRGLRDLGHADMILWVMEQNVRGCRFYESRLGMSPVEGARQSFEIDGCTIWEIAYGLSPLPAHLAAN
jgi:hypothetical protein